MSLVKALRKNAAITVLTLLAVLVNFYILLSYLKHMVGIQLAPKFQVVDSKSSGNWCSLYGFQQFLLVFRALHPSQAKTGIQLDSCAPLNRFYSSFSVHLSSLQYSAL